MTGRHLAVLALVAVVAIAAALWATSVREPVSVSSTGTELLAGFDKNVNDVTAVRIYAAGEEPAVTLTRDEKSWRVAQKGGYPADNSRVRKLLLDLGNARLLEEKTSNPSYYPRIGVQDDGGGDNVRLEFEGTDAAPVIVGDLESAREAVYVRRVGEATSWLASGAITIDTDPLQWLNREIVDIPASRIAAVELRHPDGETLSIAKDTFGQDNFAVANIPQGRELQRDNIADPIAAVLAGLRFDDVLPAADVEFDGEPVTAGFRTFDGVLIHVETLQTGDMRYARLRADTDAATAARYQLQPDADDEAGDDEAGDDDAGDNETAAEQPQVALTPPEPDMSGAIAAAQQLNDTFDGWVYTLPQHKFDQLTRRLDDLLAAAGE